MQCMLEEIQSITQNSWLITAVLAITIFVAGLIIGNIAGKIVQKIMQNLQVNELISKKTPLIQSQVQLLHI
jgi:F0F1-type ATP synthase membrane subunit c/vacuolar-type H+-ATPase subunit K